CARDDGYYGAMDYW
nr:immunoglobulin heavy chain junction region [Mus musculus]